MKAILLALWLPLCINISALNQANANGLHQQSLLTVTGKVVDQDNGQPIAGATVILTNAADTLIKQSTITSESGIYKFSGIITGTYRLSVNHVAFTGYINTSVIINQSDNLQLPVIKLISRNNNLKEVVIKGGLIPLVEQHLDKTVVNVGSLLSNSGVSAVDVLSNSPAVEVTETGITLRGKTGVTVYVDGQQLLLDGQNLANYLKSLPSSTLEKIELMPNPPAKYHSDGGGVINIITKKTTIRGLSGNLSLGAARAAFFNSDDNLNLNYRTKKINFYLTAAYSNKTVAYQVGQQRKYTGTKTSLIQNNAEVDWTRSYRTRLGISYDKDPCNSFGLLIDGTVSPYRETGNYNLTFNHQLPDSSIITQSSLSRNTHNLSTNVNYRHTFAKPHQSFSASIDYLNYNDNTKQQIASETYSAQPVMLLATYGLITRNPFEAIFYSFKTDFDTQIKGINFSTGIQGNYSTRNSEGNYANGSNEQLDSLSSRQQGSERTGAIYVSLNKDFKSISFQAGLRYEQTAMNSSQSNLSGKILSALKLNYADLLPSFYISYQLNKALRNSLLFSFNSQVSRPGYATLNPFIFHFDKYSLLEGNPLLQPEHNYNFELSYNQQSNFSIGTRINLSHSPIIQYFSLLNQTIINTSVNIHSSSYAGIFSNYTITPVSWWSINGYTELYHQTYKGPTTTGDYFYNSVASLKLQLSNQYNINNTWRAELSVYYTSNNTYGQGLTMPLWRTNSSMQKKILNNRGSLVLSGTDIFHTQVIRRLIDLETAQIIRRNSYDSRKLTLTFLYRFGAAFDKQKIKSGLDAERGRIGVN